MYVYSGGSATSFTIQNDEDYYTDSDLGIPVYMYDGYLNASNGNEVTGYNGSNLATTGSTIWVDGDFDNVTGYVTLNGDTTIYGTDYDYWTGYDSVEVDCDSSIYDLDVYGGDVGLYGHYEYVGVHGGTVNTYGISVYNPQAGNGWDYGIEVNSGTLNLNDVNDIWAYDYGMYVTGGNVNSYYQDSGAISGDMNALYATGGTMYFHKYSFDLTEGEGEGGDFPIEIYGTASLQLDGSCTINSPGISNVYGDMADEERPSLLIDEGNTGITAQGEFGILTGTVTTGNDLEIYSTSIDNTAITIANVKGVAASHDLLIGDGKAYISGSFGMLTVLGGEVTANVCSIYDDIDIEGGTLTVDAANLAPDPAVGAYGTVEEDGSLVINVNATVKMPFTNFGSYIVNNGTLTALADIENRDGGLLEIKGGTIYADITNRAGGDVEVSGGTISDYIYNYGTFDVTGGTISGTILNYTGGDFTISGGTVHSNFTSNSGDVYVTGGTVDGVINGDNTGSGYTGNLYIESPINIRVDGQFANIAGAVTMTDDLRIYGTTDSNATYGEDKAVVTGVAGKNLIVDGGDVTLSGPQIIQAIVYGGKLTDMSGNTVYGYDGTVIGGSSTSPTALYVDNSEVPANYADVDANGYFSGINVYSGDTLYLTDSTTVSGIVVNAGTLNVDATTSVSGAFTNSGTLNITDPLTASSGITDSGTIYVKTGGSIAGTVTGSSGNLYVRSGTSVDVKGSFINLTGAVDMTDGALTIGATTDSLGTYGSSAAVVEAADYALTLNGGTVTLNGDAASVAITGGTLIDNGGNTVTSTTAATAHVHGTTVTEPYTTLIENGSGTTYANGNFAVVRGQITSCGDLYIIYAGTDLGGATPSLTYASIGGGSAHSVSQGLITSGSDLTVIGGYAYIYGYFADINNSATMKVNDIAIGTGSLNGGYTCEAECIDNTGAFTVDSEHSLYVANLHDRYLDEGIYVLTNSGTGTTIVLGTLEGDIINTSTVGTSTQSAITVTGTLTGNLTTSAGQVDVLGTTFTTMNVTGGTAYVYGVLANLVGPAAMSGSLTIDDTVGGKATISGASEVDYIDELTNYPDLTVNGGSVDVIGGLIGHLNVYGGAVAVTGGVFNHEDVAINDLDPLESDNCVRVVSPGTLRVLGGYFIDDSMALPVNYIATGYTYKATLYAGLTYNKVQRAVAISGGGSLEVTPEPEPILVLEFDIGETDSFLTNEQNDKKLLPMDVAPILVEDRTFLPIRFVVEPLGGTITWTQAEQKVTIVRGGITIELWIGNNIAKVNGVNRMIDPANPNVMPLLVDPGRTMLPLRFISEALGCDVAWNELTQQITVTEW